MSHTRENVTILLNNLYQEVTTQKKAKTVLFFTDEGSDVGGLLSDFLRDKKDRAPLHVADLRSREVTPYYPFLTWIGDGLSSSKKAYDSIAREKIYYPFQNLFTSLSEKKVFTRDEEPIMEELDFEKRKLSESLAHVYGVLLDGKPSIALVGDLKHLPLSTMEFLVHLGTDTNEIPLLLLLVHNKNEIFNTDKAQASFSNLLGRLETRSIVVDVRSHTHSQFQTRAESTPARLGDRQWIEALNLSMALCAFDDAYFIASHVHAQGESPFLSKKDWLRVQLVLGDVHYYSGKNELAMIQYQTVLSTALTDDDPAVLHQTYRRLSQVYYLKNNLDNAQKFAYLSLKLSEGLGERAEFYSLFGLLVIDDKENRLDQDAWIGHFRKIIELAVKLGYKNSLAFWLTRHDRFDIVVHRDEIERMIDEAIELSQGIKNTMRLAAAYHAKGLFFIYTDDYQKVKHYYEKAEQLTLSTGNSMLMARICNGFGFFYLQNGDYKNAEAYMLRAFEYSYNARDFNEIAMTVCNVAFNYLLCHQFETAQVYQENLLIILKNLGIKDLPYHSQLGIYSLIAVCYYKLGELSKFLEHYNFIKSFLADKTSHSRIQNFTEEELLYKLISAYYCDTTGRQGKAEKHLAEGEIFLKQKFSLIKYLAPFFYSEKALFYQKHNDVKKYAEGLNEGRQTSVLTHNQGYSEYFDGLLNDKNAPMRFPGNPLPLVDFSKVLDITNVAQSLTLLNKKIEELDFLYSFQNILSSTQNKTELILSASRLYTHNFNFDTFILQRSDAVSSETLFCRSSFDSHTQKFEMFLQFIALFRNKSGMLLTPEGPGDQQVNSKLEFSSVISLPLETDKGWRIHLVCATSHESPLLTQNEFRILSISLKQLVSALVKLEQDEEIKEKNRMLELANEQLYEKATTDSLTKLYNRQSLLQRIREVQERNKRKQNKTPEYYSLFYVDLDNFKFYNDAFGHQIGDLLLIEFSTILKKSIRTCDYVSRFGGDEFVILLPETDETGSIVIAKRILHFLAESDSFTSLIETHLKRKVDIPDDKKLSCSIGITSNSRDLQADIETLLHQADTALYKSKVEGRNRFSTYP